MLNHKNAARVPFGAWHQEKHLLLSFPEDWHVRCLSPNDSPPIDANGIGKAFSNPIGCPRLQHIARRKQTAIIAVDDITRPTPTGNILPKIIKELRKGGIKSSNIRILIGTAAHRPMTPQEIRKKLGQEIGDKIQVIVHDFAGPDICNVGWVKGGPVYLNRHFLRADLRICVGCVMPHNETGFGGGAKLVVPGISGHLTISHLHGALPPRLHGALESKPGVQDRRVWAEEVARYVGVDSVVCAVVNLKRELAGLYVGDLVKAHRAAAQFAVRVGRTAVASDLAKKADIVVVNSYPLDTDPMQMGKSVAFAQKLSPKYIVAINAASDGIFYHGMGMGSGIHLIRLVRNLPYWLLSPRRLFTWLRSMVCAIKSPVLMARLSYFSLNHLSYSSYRDSDVHSGLDADATKQDCNPSNLLVFSPNFPMRGFIRRYPNGCLYRDWHRLCAALSQRWQTPPTVLLFPCTPLQILDIT